MQQRRVRLGDVLDDYCPRERRITNHAVVAMIDDEVKQTRCATCDAEHEYKAARVPAPRRKKAGGALPDRPEALVRPRPPAAVSESEPDIEQDQQDQDEAAAPAPVTAAAVPGETNALSAEPTNDDTRHDDASAEDEGSGPQDDWVHRPLIRATLPRQEGQQPERKAPDFTLRQNGGRFDNRNGGQRHRGPRQGRPGQGQFRQAQGQPSGGRVGGQGGHRQGQGPQGPRHGQGHGQGPGHVPRHGSGQPGNRAGSPQGQRGAGRPGGQPRGPRHQGSGGGRKRGR